MPSSDFETLLGDTPVVPVLVVEEVATAIPLARALMDGGLPLVEITLRTKAAFDVIRAISAEVEGAIVGAGTVLTSRQFQDAEAAGAKFIVSPGSTMELFGAANQSRVPFLPGAASPTEVMHLFERAYRCMKFFPAEPAGGIAWLEALASPLPGARFCPTGGIDAERAKAYLDLPNVVCVGGSWVAPSDAVRAGDWSRITALAREAAGLRAPG